MKEHAAPQPPERSSSGGTRRRWKAEHDVVSGDTALRWLICGVVLSLLGLVCGIAGGPRHAGAGEARYVYDSLNRLIAVSDETGDTAIYRYDAVGNLLTITRHGANEVLILDFVPQSGIPGTIVTIRGANFSPDPGQNQIGRAHV